MAIISKESLLKVLTSYNPWWKTGTVNPKLSKTYKRFAFYEAMKRLNQTDIRRTVVLTGTRRVGKTTIQYQMIETLLQNGVLPQKIVFISMDHPMIKLSALNESWSAITKIYILSRMYIISLTKSNMLKIGING